MVDAYMVEYNHYGEQQRFITLDKTRADDYAIQHKGIVYGLIKWLETADSSKTSQPLCTTEKAACCQPAGIPT
jgi:hypothetical protein